MARWKPEQGERYFFVGDNGFVNFTYWDSEEVDHDYYNFGNVFQTEEEAEKALEMVKALLLSFHKDNIYSNDNEREDIEFKFRILKMLRSIKTETLKQIVELIEKDCKK